MHQCECTYTSFAVLENPDGLNHPPDWVTYNTAVVDSELMELEDAAMV